MLSLKLGTHTQLRVHTTSLPTSAFGLPYPPSPKCGRHIYAATLASIYPFRLADVAPLPRSSGYLHFTKEPPDELRFSNSTGAKMECAASGHPEAVSAA